MIDHQLWVFFSFPPKFSAPPTFFFHDFPRIVVAIVLSTCCLIAALMGIAFFVWHSMRSSGAVMDEFVPPRRGGAADAGADAGASAAATATKRCHAESLEGGDRCGFWWAFLEEIPEVWMLGKAS